MKLMTERLEIVLLTPQQLMLWCDDLNQLEQLLNCVYDGQSTDGFMGGIVKNQISICQSDINNLWCHGFWLIVNKNSNIAVGSCGFKGVPNDKGEIEIGYGLGDNHTHKGYMTECITAISAWALEKSNVDCVIAETEPNNTPSENVLIRCGYAHYKTVGENKWWRL